MFFITPLTISNELRSVFNPLVLSYILELLELIVVPIVCPLLKCNLCILFQFLLTTTMLRLCTLTLPPTHTHTHTHTHTVSNRRCRTEDQAFHSLTVWSCPVSQPSQHSTQELSFSQPHPLIFQPIQYVRPIHQSPSLTLGPTQSTSTTLLHARR